MKNGNNSIFGNIVVSPGKRFLFFVTKLDPWNCVYQRKGSLIVKTSHDVRSRCDCNNPWNSKGKVYLSFVRTYNRIRSPRYITSSSWRNVSKGSRQIRSVTLGKRLALRAENLEIVDEFHPTWLIKFYVAMLEVLKLTIVTIISMFIQQLT